MADLVFAAKDCACASQWLLCSLEPWPWDNASAMRTPWITLGTRSTLPTAKFHRNWGNQRIAL